MKMMSKFIVTTFVIYNLIRIYKTKLVVKYVFQAMAMSRASIIVTKLYITTYL